MEVEAPNIAIPNSGDKVSGKGRALPDRADIATPKGLVRRLFGPKNGQGILVAEDCQMDRDRLEYLTAMLSELRRMAGADDHPMLSYLLEMAWLEARAALDDDGASGRRRDKRNAVA